jgi:hypothetical protein
VQKNHSLSAAQTLGSVVETEEKKREGKRRASVLLAEEGGGSERGETEGGGLRRVEQNRERVWVAWS